jgi:hypothetical protein
LVILTCKKKKNCQCGLTALSKYLGKFWLGKFWDLRGSCDPTHFPRNEPRSLDNSVYPTSIFFSFLLKKKKKRVHIFGELFAF